MSLRGNPIAQWYMLFMYDSGINYQMPCQEVQGGEGRK